MTSQDVRPEPFSGQWWSDVLLGLPLTILVVVVVALVLRAVLHRLVDRLVEQVSAGRGALRGRSRNGEGVGYSERRSQRATTMGQLFKSIVSVTILAVAGVILLAEIGIDVGPIIASAGILGVAIGFGAQNPVKDFLSGVFMLLEDQFGVGDVIDMGSASGVVEEVGLRVTQLRDVHGTVWYVRNGEVLRVGNSSQGWARAVVDVTVSRSEDVEAVRALLASAAAGLSSDPATAALVLEEPQVWGVEDLTADGVVVRVVVKTVAATQSDVARVLRARIADAIRAAGIDVPPPA